MLNVLIVISTVLQILLSLTVLLRGRKNGSFLLFFFIGISTLAWALVNYLTIVFIDSDQLIFLVRLILFFVVFQNAAFYYFAKTYPSAHFNLRSGHNLSYLVFSFVAASATLSPYVFVSVEVEEGLAITEAGPGILVFISHAAFSIGYAFKQLAKKHKASSGLRRRQFQLLIAASILNWILVPITNFALSPLLQTTVFIELSPLYTLLFASIIGYAIVSQKLFDVKLIIARAVSYILIIGTVGAVFAAFVLSALGVFINYEPLSNTQFFVVLFSTLLVTFSFNFIKEQINSLSSQIFFRDAYNSQAVLNELSSILATEIDLISIIRESSKVISNSIRPTYLRYVVFDSRKSVFYDFGTVNAPNNTIDYEDFEAIEENLIVKEYEKLDIQKTLSKYDAEAVLKLKTNDEFVGLILMGVKQNGTSYSQQDLDLMAIAEKELAISIQNARYLEQIQQFNVTLQRKVKQATKRLEHSNEKLKQLDEAKDEFISMASHQLRTPLTSIKGYVSMVMEGDAGKVTAQQKKLLEEAFASSQRMVYLIADLLNVSRLRTGKFIIEKSTANMADMVESEVAQLKATAKSRKLALNYTKPKRFPDVELDETKTRQVIMNFIDNAIYYTPAGGTIDVSIKSTKTHIEFVVKDDGIGVPKSKQSKLFSKFYRADNAQKARPDGTGLGLFMAKKVIIAQGGSIIFESKEGKGSTFGFRLPRNPKK